MLKKSLLMISVTSSLVFTSASYADTSAYTEQATANMNVSLTVLKACSITASDMSFGKQYSNAGDLSVSTTASVVCTKIRRIRFRLIVHMIMKCQILTETKLPIVSILIRLQRHHLPQVALVPVAVLLRALTSMAR